MYLTKADEGWAWLILVVSFLDHCITGFCMYAVGLFHITILERFYESVTLTSWLSSIFLCLLSLSGPGASLLIDKWNCRVTMVVGSIMLTTGLVVTAYFNSILMVLVFFSLIGAGLTLQACAFGAVLRPSSLEISAKLSRMNRKESRCACNFTVVKDKALLSVGFAALFFNIGFIVDNGGSYDMSFSIAGVSLILGGSIELLNVLFKKERYEKPTTKDILISVSSISQQDIVITETASEQECDCTVYNSEQETAAFKKNYST